MIIWLWIGFLAIVLAMLAIDLGVLHRKSRIVKVSEAAIWTTIWVLVDLHHCSALDQPPLAPLVRCLLFGLTITAQLWTVGRDERTIGSRLRIDLAMYCVGE